MDIKPKHRSNDLVTQELKDEILIYDLNTNKAYRLNETLAEVWDLCDGKSSIMEISQKINRKHRTKFSEDLIWLALDELKKNDLLENAETIKSKFTGMSRREVVRKIGLTSMIALPIISSIVAPSAAEAQSGNAVICRRPIPGGICLEKDCPAGSCSGVGCITVDSITPLCCSGISYAVPQPPSAPGAVDISYFCR